MSSVGFSDRGIEPSDGFSGDGFVDGLDSVELLVACNVETRFVDAATVFGPQKGASAEDVIVLTERLDLLADRYLDEFGVDVRTIEGGGAAGGLAGALAVLGGRLVSGFELVARRSGSQQRSTRPTS